MATTSSSSSSNTPTQKKSTNPRFPNWTFDKPCARMEWTPLSKTKLSVDRAVLQDADLVVLGVMVNSAAASPTTTTTSQAKETQDSCSKNHNNQRQRHLLTGFAATIDQGLHGALSELMHEPATEKALQQAVGGTSSILRVVVGGGIAPTAAQQEQQQQQQQQQSSSTSTASTSITKRYALLSLGAAADPKHKNDDKKTKTITNKGFAIGKALASLCRSTPTTLKTIRVCFPSNDLFPDCAQVAFLRDVSTSFYADLYADNRYRTKETVVVQDHVTTVNLIASDGGYLADASAIVHGQHIARGIIMAKDIVNAPHNVLNSESLADTAQRIAHESKNACLTCQILDPAACEALGMGAYLAVARGSETQPQFLHLTYRPPGGNHLVHHNLHGKTGVATKKNRKIGLVGKGLLFDTGGYNVKTQLMELMKFDCGGAAAILGAARAIGQLQPAGVEAHFIVAACENMINQKAFCPSDVVQAANGVTIEIKNTDAEGRLTLADALVYADQHVGCEQILELSTLTGGMMVALGKELAGVFTENDALAEELADISKETQEKTWRMPVVPEYQECLKSSIADVNHLGTRYGGSIHAMLFLQHFVDADKPFAHIDMAGPCWDDKNGVATGYGAKMVTEWITRQGKKE